MRTLRPLSTLGFAIALALVLPARGRAQIEQGDKRFSLNGSISKSTSAGSETEANIQGEFGWYWKRNVSLNAGAAISTSGSTTFTILAVGTEVNWSDPGDTKVPFVSMAVGSGFGSGINALVLQPGVGAHFFLSRQTSFDLEGLYRYTNVSFAGQSGSDGTFEVNFGFSFYFGGGSKR